MIPLSQMSLDPTDFSGGVSRSVHGTFSTTESACSQGERQYANSPHIVMIHRRKPLRGADDFFFLTAHGTPRVLAPRAAARFARAQNCPCKYMP